MCIELDPKIERFALLNGYPIAWSKNKWSLFEYKNHPDCIILSGISEFLGLIDTTLDDFQIFKK